MLVLKIALGVVLALVLASVLFSARVTVGPANTKPATTLSTDEKMCADGYQPACDELDR